MNAHRITRIMRGALCVAVLLPLLSAVTVFAEGDERIGTAQVELATATGVATGGTSLRTQPATLAVDVPAGATVEQVLVHWVGLHKKTDSGDRTLSLDGVPVTGKLIGGPVLYSWNWRTSAYRADITALGLIGPGSNALDVTGSRFSIRSSGISITVLYSEPGEIPLDLDLRDGADVVIKHRKGLQASSVAQTFSVPAAVEPRAAELLLVVADADEIRPQDVLVTIDGVSTSYPDLLGDPGLFAAVKLPVVIPAGVTDVTVEVRSLADPTRPTVAPSSMVWVVGGIAADPPPPPCTFFTPDASGRAYGLDIAAFPLIGPQGPFTDTEAENPAGPEIPIIVDPVLSDLVLQATNDLDLAGDRAQDRAIAIVNDFDLTLGDHTIAADSIVAVSSSVATQQSATSTGLGSRIQNLVIDGTTYGDLTSGDVIELGGGAFPLLRVTVLGQTPAGAAAGVPQPDAGTYSSSLAVDGLRIQLIGPAQAEGALDVDIVLAHAESSASVQAPVGSGCPDGSNLYGRAFLVSLDTVPDEGFGAIAGEVVLPSGGGDEAMTAVDLSTLVGAATGSSSTIGDLAGPSVDSTAVVEDLDLFNQGQLLAELVRATSSSTALGETGGTVIAGLVIGGQDVCAGLGLEEQCEPPANTVYPIPGVAEVILNEQIRTDDGLIVNAVHIIGLGALPDSPFPIGFDLVIASAESDATR